MLKENNANGMKFEEIQDLMQQIESESRQQNSQEESKSSDKKEKTKAVDEKDTTVKQLTKGAIDGVIDALEEAKIPITTKNIDQVLQKLGGVQNPEMVRG